MVKETKKKSQGGEIEQLEIEIDSNEIQVKGFKNLKKKIKFFFRLLFFQAFSHPRWLLKDSFTNENAEYFFIIDRIDLID